MLGETKEAMQTVTRREPTIDELKTRLTYIARKSTRRSNALHGLHKAYELQLRLNTLYLDRIKRDTVEIRALRDRIAMLIPPIHVPANHWLQRWMPWGLAGI